MKISINLFICTIFVLLEMNFESILNDLLGIPRALLNCLNYYLSGEGLEKLKSIPKMIKSYNIEQIVFIGHSYNYFASSIAYYLINSFVFSSRQNLQDQRKINCMIEEIDEFLGYYNYNLKKSKSIFVFISQSGNSVQIQEGIKKLREAEIPEQNIWGVCNNSDSFLAKNVLSDYFFPINSGKEEVIGTKSYINCILVLNLISRFILGDTTINTRFEEEIRQLIFEIKFYGQDVEFHTRELVKFLGDDFSFLYFISKGASLSTAFQAAQSCTAYTRTFAEGISMGLFLHGPFQIVDDTFRCVLIVGDDSSVESTLELMDLITKKIGKGKVILINNSRKLSSMGRANENIYVFEHTITNPYLAPMFEIIVIQYLLLEQAKKRGVIL